MAEPTYVEHDFSIMERYPPAHYAKKILATFDKEKALNWADALIQIYARIDDQRQKEYFQNLYNEILHG